MQLIQYALVTANKLAMLETKNLINHRRKAAKSLWRIWKENESASRAMACHKVIIVDYRIAILGKRDGLDCAIHITKDSIKVETQAPCFTQAEAGAILRVLKYYIHTNFDKNVGMTCLHEFSARDFMLAHNQYRTYKNPPESIYFIDSGACIELANASKAIAYVGKAWPALCPK